LYESCIMISSRRLPPSLPASPLSYSSTFPFLY
jgi:hypothetical protein